MRKIIYSLLVVALSMTACQDRFEDYFGEENAKDAQKSIFETLGEMSDYSRFYNLLNETGLDSLFDRNQIMTVWAPSNENVPEEIEAMSMRDKKALVLNHINLTKMDKIHFNSVSQFEALSGKFLRVSHHPDALNKSEITKFDILCRDGIINTISDWNVPQYNVYDYLDALDESYSIFRDTILSYNDTIFDYENSKIIGYNEDAQPIFDSVFVIENAFVQAFDLEDSKERTDLSDESQRFTMFIPSNSVLEKMYKETSDYFKNIGKEISSSDSSYWFTWVKEASLYDYEIDYSTEVAASYKSMYGRDFRSDYQDVEDDFVQCSNGKIYLMRDYYIPRYPYYFDTTFFDTEYVIKWYQDEGKKYFDVAEGCSFDLETMWLGDGLNGQDKDCGVVSRSGEGPLWVEFRSVNKPITTGLYEEVKVMPGTYTLYGNVYGAGEFGPDTTTIYINDVYMGDFPANTFKDPQLDPDRMKLICKDFVVTDTFDMLKLKFVDFNDGYRSTIDFQSSPRIVPGLFKLIPSSSNY